MALYWKIRLLGCSISKFESNGSIFYEGFNKSTMPLNEVHTGEIKLTQHWLVVNNSQQTHYGRRLVFVKSCSQFTWSCQTIFSLHIRYFGGYHWRIQSGTCVCYHARKLPLSTPPKLYTLLIRNAVNSMLWRVSGTHWVLGKSLFITIQNYCTYIIYKINNKTHFLCRSLSSSASLPDPDSVSEATKVTNVIRTIILLFRDFSGVFMFR